jgi:hypothetical protein
MFGGMFSSIGSVLGGAASKATDFVSGAMSTVGSAASTVFDMATAPAKMLGSGISSIASSVGGWLFGSSANDSATASTQTATAVPPKAGMQDMVQRDKATSEPSSTNIGSPELTNIANETSYQTQLNEQMVELLTKLVDAIGEENLSSGGSPAPDADTSSRKTMNKPYMNAKWAFGAYMQTSGKQVSNIGSGTK